MTTSELATSLNVSIDAVTEMAACTADIYDAANITTDADGNELWTGQTLSADHAAAVTRLLS